MRVKSPDPQPRDDGEYLTYVNGAAYGKPYGKIYLDEDRALALRDITLDDARRLATAAARVERELAAAHAAMTAPHGRGEIYNGTCQLCGKPGDDSLHADPDAGPCRCGHADTVHAVSSPEDDIEVLDRCLAGGCDCTQFTAARKAAAR